MAVPHDTLWAWALSACLLSGLADPATGSPAPAPKTQAAAAPKTPAAPGAFISEGTGGPWPAPVPGFVPPQPGEHPRLFFRKTDLAALKARAKTPEGQAILARLRVLLGGGEALPTVYNQNTPVNIGAKGAKEMPLGAYTLWHGAGFGFLYQITGDKKYADLARQCVEKAIDGQVDRDERYNWTTPGAGLRVGPCLSGIAMPPDSS